MARILFLTQVLPYPLDAGPKVRAYYVLRYLSIHHKITLLTFFRPSDATEWVNHLDRFCEKVVAVPITRSAWKNIQALIQSFIQNKPFLILRDQESAMQTAIQEVIQNDDFDFIHADQLWMTSYAKFASECAKKTGSNPKIILDQHNAVFMIPHRLGNSTRNPLKKYLLARESKLMAEYETITCSQFDHVVWVSKDDYRAVREVNKSLQGQAWSVNNSIIPICVEPAPEFTTENLTASPHLLFVGGMHWPPNADGILWFHKKILPLITQQFPQIKCQIIGKSPPARILDSKQITAPGYVQDLDGYWKNNRIFIVPLRAGGGMRVKIIDAWSKGLPVVSTTVGAEGICYQNGINIQIADSPVEFAEAVCYILEDNDFANKLRQLGNKNIQENYDWRTVYKKWDAVYETSKIHDFHP